MLKPALLSLWLLTSTPGIAATPPSDWPLVGQAQLQVLWWDIYQARLFSPDGTSPPLNGPLLLQLTYLRNIDATRLLDETGQQLQPYSSAAQRRQWLTELARLWPDVKKGDRLSLLITSGQQAHFFLNDLPLGSVHDPDFAPAFASIWLAADSQYPELAQQLRGDPSPPLQGDSLP